ncbi:MAG: chemotaxis protein CheW [Thermoanaerobaculaceae bacterium]|nr:chemotaxis protein CheW [Thermoanaerobaculaceae bacterium]
MEEKKSNDKKPKEKLKINLPKSGLAEDIFSENKKGDEGVSTSPERLFAFADSLQTQKNAEEVGDEKEAKLETWVTFLLESECYGLPVSHVQEILRVSGITRVPHAPHPVRGVTNLRGKVLPVVDLSVRLGLKEKEITNQSRILVVSSKGRILGLLVDSVQQVVRIDLDKIQPPPPDVMTDQSDYIQGVYHFDKNIVILLNVDKTLIIKDALEQLRKENENEES